jgi:hypothetical protein
MKGQRLSYNVVELWWLERNKRMSRRDLHAQFVAKFERNEVSLDHIKALCTRRGWSTGRTGCFEKGAVPANKGKKMPFNAASARTQFKKGQRPHNTKEAGAEYVSASDGYVYISVNETNPHTGFERRFVMKHKFLWEQLHGPIPEGMCLKSIDGNRQNSDPSNWQLISRSMLPRLSGGPHRRHMNYDEAPAELRPTIMAIAKLEQTARDVRSGNG